MLRLLPKWRTGRAVQRSPNRSSGSCATNIPRRPRKDPPQFVARRARPSLG
jgi:hypothetical protein